MVVKVLSENEEDVTREIGDAQARQTCTENAESPPSKDDEAKIRRQRVKETFRKRKKFED